ncbi:unnamed protein product [Polarella glacialis]|uniref:Exostosin GT47 domain-containing protein n=2 Tax=Polarella glacialis TaxID=89957 RepID=A0A813E545_POLGL|nr:unnamed protein product [Polarella glacialis]
MFSGAAQAERKVEKLFMSTALAFIAGSFFSAFALYHLTGGSLQQLLKPELQQPVAADRYVGRVSDSDSKAGLQPGPSQQPIPSKPILASPTTIPASLPGSGAAKTQDAPSLQSAKTCLRLTTPSLELEYPEDAEAHFMEVNASLDSFTKGHKYHCAAGYCGPWVENHWIHHFSTLWKNRPPGTRLSDIFGPYIPILIPWVDTWVNKGGYHFPGGMIEALKKILRPNVLYITVAQNDQGWLARSGIREKDMPNVLVLSGGGYGHVPVPLLKADENLTLANPVGARKYIVSFVGTLGHAPQNLRGKMAEIMQKWAKELSITDKVNVGSDKNWRDIMTSSRFSMNPRGYGRTSYHLAETLHMGLIPIHLYIDIPWVPYMDLYQKAGIGFNTNIAGFRPLLDKIKNMSAEEVYAMEQRVRKLRESHFTPSGAMEQISKWMTGKDGGGDLRCQQLPKSDTR